MLLVIILDNNCTAIRCLRAKRVGIATAEKMAVENYSFIECQFEINPPKSLHHLLIQTKKHLKCDRYLLVVVI